MQKIVSFSFLIFPKRFEHQNYAESMKQKIMTGSLTNFDTSEQFRQKNLLGFFSDLEIGRYNFDVQNCNLPMYDVSRMFLRRSPQKPRPKKSQTDANHDDHWEKLIFGSLFVQLT